MYYFIITLFLCAHTLNATQVITTEKLDFTTSFINNYDFYSNAYDTHEYHPFILHQTKLSFERLESYLSHHDFTPIGRILIMGYQEDAIPSYYTEKHTQKINDESSTKIESDWQFASGNTAGFITGFALQSCNQFSHANLMHIAPDRVELFDPHATLFHKHAFGESYPYVISMYAHVARALASYDNRQVLKTLKAWWQKLYIDACRDGAHHVVATQDILFTIAYGDYLLQSALPILAWYTGPDITYPIERLDCQELNATDGAQAFLTTLRISLNKPHKQKTAYIFCSFIDGVGKSTLLGNLRNRQQYGTQFEKYTRVDNSSSQRATLSHYTDTVVIADLPAQISHHTIKPSGSVYVDLRTIKECTLEHRTLISAYAEKNMLNLIAQHTHNPETPYAKLCAQIKRTNTPWIPFCYEGDEYLVHRHNPKQLKILTPFEKVHSSGLKVVEPEHMIFHNGINMPMIYDQFLDDLSTQLRDAGVQDIIFVDFISMYPRTSRETIRVNFLLQQLYAIYGNAFDQSNSMYHHTPHPYDYYLMLVNHKDGIKRSMLQETLLRNAWYDLLINRQKNVGLHIPAAGISPLLCERIAALSDKNAAHIEKLLDAKISLGIEEFESSWAHDKLFETIVRFDHNKLLQFSSWLNTLFTQIVTDDYYHALWARDHDTVHLEILKTLPNTCRDAVELQEIIPHLRAHWYAILSNILGFYKKNDAWFVREYGIAVPPLWVEKSDTNAWHIIRTVLPEFEGKTPTLPPPFSVTHTNHQKIHWEFFYEKPHCTSWSEIDTTRGLYAYSFDPTGASGNKISILIRTWLHQQENTSNATYLTTHELLQLLTMYDGFAKNTKTKPYVKQCAKEAAQLFVRALATLDMILKDPQASCLQRTENRQDFKAALILTERITLPQYFGISFPSPLFENYDTVNPVI